MTALSFMFFRSLRMQNMEETSNKRNTDDISDDLNKDRDER